jgi:hypothetical protein
MKTESFKSLISAINSCLYGPGGDPIRETLDPGTTILKVLIDEGHEKDIDPTVIKGWNTRLSPEGNIEQSDYLDEFGLVFLRDKYGVEPCEE